MYTHQPKRKEQENVLPFIPGFQNIRAGFLSKEAGNEQADEALLEGRESDLFLTFFM